MQRNCTYEIMQNIGMKILRNFKMDLYAENSLLKDQWKDFSKTKLAVRLAF